MGGNLQPAQGNIGLKLRRTRLKLGMTQRNVAESIGLDQTTISAVERGVADPNSRRLVKNWLIDPSLMDTHVSDTLLEAAVQTGDPEKRQALVKTWMNLYGEREAP